MPRMRVAPALLAIAPAALAQDTMVAEAQGVALRARRDLPGAGEVASIDLSEPGWLFGARVAPGRYRVEAAGRRFLLRDAEDRLLGWEPRAQATSVEEERDKLLALRLRRAAAPERWIFVPERVLAPALGIQARAAAGPVVVEADFDAPDLLDRIVRGLAASAPRHARLLGAAAAPAPLNLVLLHRGESFARVDALLNGTPLDRAFASRLTGCAYVHFPWFAGEHAELVASSAAVRATLEHELSHLVVRGLGRGALWPRWLHEGVAELAAERCMPEGWVERRWRARYAHARRAGTLPAPADLLDGHEERDAAALYAAAFGIVRAAARDERALAELLAAAEEASSAEEAAVAASERARAAGDFAEGGEGLAALGVVAFGYVDEIPEGVRLLAPDGGRATAFFPAEEAPGGVVEIDYALSYRAAGARQAGLYLGCAWGRRTTRLMQVTVAPQQVSLWLFTGNAWTPAGRAELAEPLADHPAVHEVRVRLDGAARRVRVTIGRNEPIEFAYAPPWPVRGTFPGVGTGEGIVEFRAPRVVRG
jgi:hypothetical protein